MLRFSKTLRLRGVAWRFALLSQLVLAVCTGCSVMGLSAPELSAHRKVADIADQSLFAISPEGSRVAFSRHGLVLLSLPDRQRRQLTDDRPTALIWSLAGDNLLVAFREAERTRLVRYPAANGFREQTVAYVEEEVTGFAWQSAGRLLMIGHLLTEQAGAPRLQVNLLTWNGGYEIERRPLYQAILPPPPSRQLIDQYLIHHWLEISPLQDEIIYPRYLGRPVRGERVRLILHHLFSGRERPLGEASYGQDRAVFAPDAEHVLLPDAGGQVVRLNPWTGTIDARWPGTGRSLLAAPNRDLYLIDGTLFAEKRALMRLPPEVRGEFAAEGKQLFVVDDGALYQVDGYAAPKTYRYSSLEQARLQQIRLQRSRGELSIEDYQRARYNLLNP